MSVFALLTGAREGRLIPLRPADTIMSMADEAQSLDFGSAQVEVAMTRRLSGRPVTRIAISGSFDGFEKGKSGDLLGYFEHELSKSAERVLIVLSHATYYSDLAPGLIAELRTSLRARGGDVVLAAPSPPVAAVLTLLNEPFSTTEEEALMELDRGSL